MRDEEPSCLLLLIWDRACGTQWGVCRVLAGEGGVLVHWRVGFAVVCRAPCVCAPLALACGACSAWECVCVPAAGGAAAARAQKNRQENEVQSLFKELISASVSPPPLSDVVSHIPEARTDL